MIKLITAHNLYRLRLLMEAENFTYNNQQSADIGIIGSGIACTVTLINLLEQLLETAPKKKLSVTVVEKHNELWKGIPYGSRSSVNGLTITTIADFFTDERDYDKFFDWFLLNLDGFIAEFKSRGGNAAENWLIDNEHALMAHRWDEVYLPRFIIGNYFQQRLLNLKTQAEVIGLVNFKIVDGDAIAVTPSGSGYNITINQAHSSALNVNARKVVLAIGSPPEKKLSAAFDTGSGAIYIDKIYMPSIEENVSVMVLKLKDLPVNERNILIIGSNASTIELLYLIANTSDILSLVNYITLLSTSGKLPAHITYSLNSHAVNANLSVLEHQGNYSIEMLIAAAAKDIESMHGHEVSVPDIDTIVGHTLKLLEPLDDHAKSQFYGIHGVKLAKLFRRSGADYKKATEALTKSGKLQILKGSLESIRQKKQAAVLIYNTDMQQHVEFEKTFKVVINNTGSEDLINSSSQLIQNLVTQNKLKVNHSGKAFVVNDKLEAAPNLYVIGPLIGGNYNKLLKFWHLENASRIMYLAPYLVKELLS